MFPALAVALALLCLLGAALLSPLDLRLQGGSGRRTDLRARWIYGLVRLNLRKPRLAGAKPAKDSRRKTRKKTRRRANRRLQLRRLFAVIRTPGVIPAIGRCLRRAISAIAIRELRLRLCFGFDDPADTGKAFAVLSPIVLAAGHGRNWRVVAEPDFTEERFEMDGRLWIRLYPHRLVHAALGLLLSRAAFRSAVAALKTR